MRVPRQIQALAQRSDLVGTRRILKLMFALNHIEPPGHNVDSRRYRDPARGVRLRLLGEVMTSPLAAMLEVLHETRDRFHSLHATGTSSRSDWELWWAGPRRVRQEWARNVIVVDGALWWLRQPDGEIISNEKMPGAGIGLGPGAEILHGRDLLGDVLLEVQDDVEIAERDAVLLRAVPDTGEGGSRWWDYPGPFEVAIDAQTGVVLQTPHVAVHHIRYDDRFPDELFSELDGRL